MKKIIMIVGLVALLGGAGFGGMMLGKKQAAAPGGEAPAKVGDEVAADATGEGGHGAEAAPAEGEAPAHGEAKEGGEGEAGAAAAPQLTYDFDKFTTNLADDLSTYVQMKVEIQAASAEGKKLVEDNVAPLRDATIMLLSSKSKADIQSLAGKERLKRELLVRYQGVLNSTKALRNIYITEFTVVRY